MAIFKKDLENINALNEKNRKINVRSELLQFINYQNDATDYDFQDFKFELDVNFKQKFDKNKNILRDFSKRRIEKDTFNKTFSIFSNFTTQNSSIYACLERLIFQVKEENDLFNEEFLTVSSSIKNSKKNAFNFLHAFLLKANKITNVIDDATLISEKSIVSTTIKNLENLDVNDFNITDKKLINTYKEVIKSPVNFLQTYVGLNFIKTNEKNLIQNDNKPLSLMSLATAINNVIEYSFDYAACNSLFKGIYTEAELNTKLKAVEFTNVPIIENDMIKEILPIKYVDNFEFINNTEMSNLITRFNDAFKNLKNVKKSELEKKIPNDIFTWENLICSDNDIDNLSFTSKGMLNVTDKIDAVSILNTNDDNLLPHIVLLNTITNSEKVSLISNRDKSGLAMLEQLNLIANHLNSNQLKLNYGVVNKTANNIPNHSNIKYRSVIDVNKKGILNYHFEDINNFTSSIIKTRLICNNIVKKYKKYSLNKGYDASSTNVLNKINLFISKDGSRQNIEDNIKSINLVDAIIKINKSNNLNQFMESFNTQDHIFEIFNKNSNKINQDLIIVNNSILGESNADDFISPNFKNVTNLNNDINKDTISINNLKEQMKVKYTNVKSFVKEYYDDQNLFFKNSATFFQEIKKLCANNFKWHLNKKNKTKMSSDRADLLNNASILWLFNDACAEMTLAQREIFQEQFVNLLISFLYINNKNLTSYKNAYTVKAEQVILNQGPTPSTTMELAPFFTFFTNEQQTATNSLTASKNKVIRQLENSNKRYNEYYNFSENVFETNGKSAHFLSIPLQLLDNNLNVSYNSGHKLADTVDLDYIDTIGVNNNNVKIFNERKRNILLTGLNTYRKYIIDQNSITYDDTTHFFMPQLTFKKISYGNNQHKFEYFLYNAAMASNYSNNVNANSYDLIQILIDTFGNNNTTIDILEQLSYNFETQNSFLNVLNFGNPYNVEVENDALNNNIFYQIASLFKDQINNLNITGLNSFNTLFTQLEINNANNILDLKFMIKNTLKIASSIYCKMFNTLQSYTNLSDRISESNFFHENSPHQQRFLKAVSTNYLNANNDANFQSYLNRLWGYSSNIFLNQSESITQFTANEFKKYRSFASKKFVYFLNEVLGIDKNEIEILMEKIMSGYVLKHNEGNNFNNFPTLNQNAAVNNFFNNTIDTRSKRAVDYNIFLAIASIPQKSLNEKNCIEFMINPFEEFNLYNSKLFQLIPGLSNFNDGDVDYNLQLSSNLTIMNIFKAGNNSDIFINNNSTNFTLTDLELSRMQDCLRSIDLFDLTRKDSLIDDFRIESNQQNIRRVDSNLLPVLANTTTVSGNATTFLNKNVYINFRDFTADLNVSTDNLSTALTTNQAIRISNKKNYNIKPKLNALNIFDLLVENSFELNLNYHNETFIDFRNNQNPNMSSNNLDQELSGINNTSFNFNVNLNSDQTINSTKRVSGLKESYTYENNFMGLNNIVNIPQISLNLKSNANQQMFKQKYVDINLNWYNHVIHGLITNDIALAMSFDLLLYYYDNFINDIEINLQKLQNSRNKKINIFNYNLNLQDCRNVLNNIPNIDTKELIDISIDNVKLQKNYMSQLIKFKSLLNLTSVLNVRDTLAAGLDKFVEKIVTLNNQNENGDFLMSYFDDFYIKELWNSFKNDNNLNKLNKNYQKPTQDYIVSNQAETVLGSHILTVGINNDYKLDKDDIILIKVEMTDHDFPEIIWEPKIFEYCASFHDLENTFLQHRNSINIQTIDNITNENVPIGVASVYKTYNVNPTATVSDNGVTLKDALIQNKNNKIVNNLNVSNNIGSINYKNDTSYLNPIVYQNKFDEILNLLTDVNEDFIFSKIPQTFREKLTVTELTAIRSDIIKRCIHNQRMNLKLSKISKLLSGFEPSTKFSLKSNQWMNDLFVLSDIYQLFIEDFAGNQDNIKEMYPFTYEEISNAVEKNAYSYITYSFHKLHFTTNHKLNVYLQFMSNLTKSLLADFVEMSPQNFQKIYTLAVNPKDFIVTGLNGGNNSFIPNSSELEFQQIIYNETTKNKFLDEIGTETSLILRLISSKTIETDDVTYYRVINKKNNNTTYIPKNVSYRISTMILE